MKTFFLKKAAGLLIALGLTLSATGYCFAETRSPREDAASSACSSGDSCASDINNLRQCLCAVKDKVNKIYNDPMWVWNKDQVEGVITLSESGSYRAGEDLIYPIEISGDKICFDLNCKELTSDDGAEDILTVKSGVSAVRIFNGCIRNIDTPLGQGAGNGILVETSITALQVDNVNIYTCGTGIDLTGSDGNEIKECEFLDLNLIDNNIGISSLFGDNNVYKNCHAYSSLTYGFYFVTSDNNCILDCKAVDMTGDGTVAGFRSENGLNNLFKGCVAKDIRTTGTDFGDIAYGIVLYENELKTKIIDCVVNTVYAPESGWSHGIFLEPEPDASMLDLFIEGPHTTAAEAKIAWSPDERYLVNSTSSIFIVYKVNDDQTLTDISSISPPGTGTVNSVAWSPDGRFIAITYFTAADESALSIYRFKGTQVSSAEVTYAPSTGDNFTDAIWSSDGHYIIAGGEMALYGFNFDGSGSTATLTFLTSDNPDTTNISFSPDSRFFVIGRLSANIAQVYLFDGYNIVQKGNIALTADALWVEWAPNGKYIAAVDDNNTIHVLSYNESTDELSSVDTETLTGAVSLSWSPDSKYLVVSNTTGKTVYSFDGSTLSSYDTLTYTSKYLEWSPSGRFIALAGAVSTYKFGIWRAMQVPGGILMQNNTVADVSAGDDTVGTGIMHTGCFDVYNLLHGSGVENVCSSNEVNFGFGIPNTFWGNHNIQRPFDNVSMPLVP